MLRPMVSKYARVTLFNQGVTRVYSVHRLVAECFVPNPHGKPEVNHKNLDKHDNRASNLEWVTSAENIAHAQSLRVGTYALTADSVATIRATYAAGLVKSVAELGRIFGVTKQTVQLVVQGDTWPNVAPGAPLELPGPVLERAQYWTSRRDNFGGAFWLGYRSADHDSCPYHGKGISFRAPWHDGRALRVPLLDAAGVP